MSASTSKGVLPLVLLVALLVALALSISSAGPASASPGGLTPHDPIHIVGDDNFTPANGVTSGSGTAGDPYIIEDWAIDASSADGIWIQNTTKYFVIRNCLVENGRPSYHGIYLDNVKNGRIENNTCRNNIHGIFLSSSSYENLTNNTCENNGWGICLWDSSYNNLTSNTCSNNGWGIWLWDSSYNNLTNNTCENNRWDGISLSGPLSEKPNHGGAIISLSSNNTLTNNTCENNEYGIRLNFYSSNNTLTNNTCSNNDYGIELWGNSSNNTIFHNYLLNNTENNAYDDNTNYWDENGEGNYWSDWQPPEHPDADEDGIVDEPRPIAGGTNQDDYPLVFPSKPFPWALMIGIIVTIAIIITVGIYKRH